MAESFLSELKRRRVVRAAGLYLVAAWLAVQVVVTVGPILRVPDEAARWVVVIAAIGFPITLALTWIYERTAQGLRRDAGADSTTVRRFSRLVLGAIALAAVALSIWVLTRTRETVAANVIAIAPFRVPASQPDLREGMIDLLGIRLTGESGPRAVDTRTLLAAWRREAGPKAPDLELKEALKVARAVKAGALLLGEITPLGDNITVSAQLFDAESGSERGSRESVTGRITELPALVDDLARKLLLLEAGENTAVGELTASFPALHAFLAGKAAFRRGELAQAISHYDRALERDSMFALAALHRFLASSWRPSARHREYLESAHRLADRLSRPDRLWLYSYASRGLDVAPVATQAQLDTDSALVLAPDRPELWFDAGDIMMHYGMLMGVANWQGRAIKSFDEAIRLDSTMAIALEHRAEMAAIQRDTATARSLAERHYAAAPNSDLNDGLRWRVGVMAGDSSTVRDIRQRLAASESRIRIAAAALLNGVSVGDAEPASRIGISSPSDLHRRLVARLQVAYALGRPALIDEVLQRESELPFDQSIAGPVVEEYLAAELASPAVRKYIGDRIAEAANLEQLPPAQQRDAWFYFGLWQYLQNNDATGGRSAVSRLRGPALRNDDDAQHRAIFLDALVEAGEKSANARVAVMRADSLSRLGPLDLPTTLNFWLARALEAIGEPAKALAAVRRREFNYVSEQAGLASILKLEGRLAEQAGDRDGAIQAYRHFLALRYQATGDFAEQTRAVQSALQRLIKDTSR